MSKVKPLEGIELKENRILIADFDVIKETKGGIILPEEQWITPVGGLIVSVGPGKVDPVSGILVPNVCKVGERVYYMQHGTQVTIKDKSYYLLRDSDVWGAMKD